MQIIARHAAEQGYDIAIVRHAAPRKPAGAFEVIRIRLADGKYVTWDFARTEAVARAKANACWTRAMGREHMIACGSSAV